MRNANDEEGSGGGGGGGGGSPSGMPSDSQDRERHSEATLAEQFANYYQGIPSGTIGGLLPNEDFTGLPIVKRIRY
jgi:hypothetical protein